MVTTSLKRPPSWKAKKSMMQQAYFPSGCISQPCSKFQLNRFSSYCVVKIYPNIRTSTGTFSLTFTIVESMQNEDNIWRILWQIMFCKIKQLLRLNSYWNSFCFLYRGLCHHHVLRNFFLTCLSFFQTISKTVGESWPCANL